MRDFEGLKAIVTGGGSGIGIATATLLANRGAAVAVLDLDPEPAIARGLHGFKADVTSEYSVHKSVVAACSALRGLDVLVNTSARAAPSRTTPTISGCRSSM